MEQINIKINADKKHKWQQKADEKGLTLTGLIKTAVQKEITETHQNDQPENKQLTESLSAIETLLVEIERDLNKTRAETVTHDEISNIVNDAANRQTQALGSILGEDAGFKQGSHWSLRTPDDPEEESEEGGHQ